MAEHNKHIDDIFRDKLGGYTETPDASVWDNIESGLDGGSSRPTDGGTPKDGGGISTGRILLLLVAGAALFFTARWAVGNFNKHKNKDGQGIIITKEESQPTAIPYPATTMPAQANDNTNESAPVNPVPDNTTNQNDVNDVTETTNTNPEETQQQKRKKRPAPVTLSTTTGTAIPSVTSAATFSPAVKTGTIKRENPETDITVPENVAQPATIQPRIKEEMAALFFNGTVRKLSTGDTPDVDYGMLDTEGSLQRLLKSIKKKLAAGRLEAGIKGGMEAGVNKYAAVKFTMAPYAQYSLGSKLSLLFQPGLKFGRLTRTNLIDAESFYNITNASVTAAHIITPATDSTLPDAITRRYYYKHTYDSLSIGYQTDRKSLFEFELPLLLQYDLTDKLSVYGGINFNFCKTVRLKEDRQQYAGLVKTDSITYPQTAVTNTAPVPPGIDSMFSYNAKPYASYGSQLWQNPTTDPMQVGYMIGCSYKIRERIRIDLLMLQNISNTSYIINKDIRSIHRQPYFRLTVGYRLFRSDVKK